MTGPSISRLADKFGTPKQTLAMLLVMPLLSMIFRPGLAPRPWTRCSSPHSAVRQRVSRIERALRLHANNISMFYQLVGWRLGGVAYSKMHEALSCRSKGINAIYWRREPQAAVPRFAAARQIAQEDR